MRDTIKNHKNFYIPDQNLTARSAFFLIRTRPTIFATGQYGLTVTKRLFKHAVDRNRAKRLLRDWLRHNEKMLLPELDYVIFARHDILSATRDEGRAAMARALHYIKRVSSAPIV